MLGMVRTVARKTQCKPQFFFADCEIERTLLLLLLSSHRATTTRLSRGAEKQQLILPGTSRMKAASPGSSYSASM